MAAALIIPDSVPQGGLETGIQSEYLGKFQKKAGF